MVIVLTSILQSLNKKRLSFIINLANILVKFDVFLKL